jgi:hypothetical protein
MFIETDCAYLPLNTAVNVSFSLSRDADREDFRLPAMVVRRTSNGAGVMFLDIDVEVLRILRRALYEAASPALGQMASGNVATEESPAILRRVAHG